MTFLLCLKKDILTLPAHALRLAPPAFLLYSLTDSEDTMKTSRYVVYLTIGLTTASG